MTVRFDKTVREHTYLSQWEPLSTNVFCLGKSSDFCVFFVSCDLQTAGSTATLPSEARKIGLNQGVRILLAILAWPACESWRRAAEL